MNPTFFRFSLIILFFPLYTSGQYVKLDKAISFDTLYVSLHFKKNFDQQLQKELSSQFDSLISVFNRNENSFYIQLDSNSSIHFIHFTLDSIKYVDLKKNLWITGMDLALIGANILIMPYFPPVIPFYLMPATSSKVYIKSSPELFSKQTTKAEY